MMSGRACDKWLESPIRRVADYNDWHEMNPFAAAAPDCLHDPLVAPDFMSVSEYLESKGDASRFFCCEYDDDERAFFIADGCSESSPAAMAAYLAALRGAESFKDDDEPSFIYIFPAQSGGDPDALLRINQGKSEFLGINDTSPEVLYFVSEAEEFVETLLEDDDD
jgi:hypothetical protein